MVRRMVKLVEELLHLRERALIGVSECFDGRRVADTEAEDEPAGEIGRESLRRGPQFGGIPCPDAGDAGRHDQPLACRQLGPQTVKRRLIRVAAAHPEGGEPGLLDRRRGRGGVNAVPFRRRHPDPYAAKPRAQFIGRHVH